jgi:hypothetical protein
MNVILPPDYDAKRDGSALFYFGDDPCFPCHPTGQTWNGFDNVRVSPQVRECIAQSWRASAMSLAELDESDEETSLGMLMQTAPDEDGLIDLSNGFATSLDYGSADAFGIDAGLTVTPEQAQWLSGCLGVGCEDEEASDENYQLARRLMELLDDGVGTLIRVVRVVDPFIARLETAGFERVDTPRGPALRMDNKVAFAEFTDRKGTGLPSDGDWALEIRVDGSEDDADTDIQCDDDGAEIGAAMVTALSRLAQLEKESTDA